MKTILRLLVLLIVVVVGAVIVAVFYVDSIARSGIEHGATSALGVETTLGEADVQILSGRFDMGELRVANPEGFETPHFLTLREGGVEVDFSTLRSDTVELPTLALTGLDVNLEQRTDGANYKAILDHIQGREKAPAPTDEASAKKFVIREVAIRDVAVHVDLLPGTAGVTRVDVPIDEIVLHDVGSDSSGVVLAELTSILTKAVIEATIKQGGGLLPPDLLGDLQSQLAQLDSIGDLGLEVVGGATEAIEQAVGELGEGLEGAIGEELGKGVEEAAGSVAGEAEKALKGLGGLLGGGDKDE